MPTNKQLEQLMTARLAFERLRIGKDQLLRVLDESEVPEAVYNSNAIENSTLTLEETERILLAVEISRHMDLREVHEAQNLGRVSEYIRNHQRTELSVDLLLLLHRMLLGNIDESIAGRFRASGEYVRVGSHVAPAPEQVESLLNAAIITFNGSISQRPSERVARLHLEFERIHPFNDGNGRIGRVVINFVLYGLGFPPIIIRNKGKERYYETLRTYDSRRTTKPLEDHLVLLMLESLHRRIAYLRGASLVPASAQATELGIAANIILNKARRQTIPAFRERGTWMIPADYTGEDTREDT